jgi:hypothetical protein
MDGIKGNGGEGICQRTFSALHNQEENPLLRGNKLR